MPRGDFHTEFYMEASAMKHEYEYETQQVKEDARGRWERVLFTLAPPLKDAHGP
jgi:hypothetical protein